MFGHKAIVIIFVLFEALFEIMEWEVSGLTHLYQLSLDEGEGLLFVEVAVAIIIEVVPDVLDAVADYVVNRHLFDTGIFAIRAFFI